MTRARRIALILPLALAILLAAAVTATIGWRPILGPRARPLTDLRIEPTPARLERGRYVVEAVSACLVCHSDNDKANYLRPVPGTVGAGRNMGPEELPFLNSTNITPDRETGIGAWTDDELARGIREGIGRDGRTLFPMMPYENYRHMSDEDLASAIVYLRSLAPVRRPTPPSSIPFPVNRLINSVPEPVTAPVAPPDESDVVARGKYLVTLGSCRDCHTPRDSRDQKILALDFSGGGPPIQGSARRASATNLTPDQSGMKYYDEARFVSAMRTGRVGARELADAMPWPYYSGMTDEDLSAMFAYIKTLKAIQHRIDNTLEPTDCPRCGHRHGGGDRNQPIAQ